MYKKWIKSYRDLPVLINQWANVVRWEMRTRLFLRTTEFLWQEGHTAHATYDEAEEEALKILEIYRKLAEEYMAIPVFTGKKTEAEKFAGAEHTYTIEAMMGDKKALQAGTTHNLGQNFAKAFDVMFQNINNELEYVYATSWGVSTRLVGSVVMAHGDDKGLILPPKIAPYQLVIIPIWQSADDKSKISEAVKELCINFDKNGIRYIVDDNDQVRPGWKFNHWEMRGVPLRLEIGPRDLTQRQVVLVRRDNRKKEIIPFDNCSDAITSLLSGIQDDLFNRALEFRNDNIVEVETYEQLKQAINDGKFATGFWAGDSDLESRIQDETKATTRCIPFNQTETGKCLMTGKTSTIKVIFAKAY